MAKNDKEVRIRKIPLGNFLDALLELYNEGLDYIDIIGTEDDVQDTIGLMFTEEYMSEEMKKRYLNDEADENDSKILRKLNKDRKNIDLSNDDDLNQII